MDSKMSYEETVKQVMSSFIHFKKKEEEKHIVEMLKCITMKLMLPTDLNTELAVKTRNIKSIGNKLYLSTLAMDQHRMISHIYKSKEYMLKIVDRL